MSKKYLTLSLILILVLGLGLSCSKKPAGPFNYSAFNLSFQTPLELSKTQDVGNAQSSAKTFSNSKNSFTIFLVQVPTSLSDALDGNNVRVRDYYRSSLLGVANPVPNNTARTVKSEYRDCLTALEENNVNKPTKQESCAFELNKTKYFLGFQYDKSFDAIQAETIIKSVFATLKVQP